MQPNQSKITKILGYVYLCFALLGLLYFLLTFVVRIESPTVEQKMHLQYIRTMLIVCIIIEIILGIYIYPAQQKILLFLQSLSTVLLFSAHGFFVYACFSMNTSLNFSSQNATNVALIFLLISTMLHIVNLFSHKIKMPSAKPPLQLEGIDGIDALFEDFN